MFPDKVRVLITEDDVDSRDMLCLLLAEQNFEVVPADGAEEALRIARTEQFNAYLIDNRLPEISGLELCKRIRQFDSQTPIVFYSGDSAQSHKDEAVLAGAQGYVVKPASCEDIVAAINAAIEGGTQPGTCKREVNSNGRPRTSTIRFSVGGAIAFCTSGFETGIMPTSKTTI